MRRVRLSRLLLFVLGSALALACSRTAPRPVRVPLADSVRRFLVSPVEGVRTGGPGPQDAAVSRAFSALLAGDVDLAEGQASGLVRAEPSDVASRALLAQIELVRGRPADAVARLKPLSESEPGYPAVQLTLGRASELAGDAATAFLAYQQIASAIPVAAERVAALGPEAAGQVAGRLQTALEAGDSSAVDGWLAWLERWLPRERATVEARRLVSAKRGDLAGELKAVRRLSAESPGDRALLWRLGELELAAGDPGKGLEIFEGLAARSPGDPAVSEGLAKARFAWRLATLPSQVQSAVRKPQLTRADLATMIYWLVPGVRTGRPSAGAIASDVLDHPRREEIVRVVNFGVMRIDDSLHLFEPGRPATRGEVNATMGRLLSLFGKGRGCTRASGSGVEGTGREGNCGLLLRCQVVSSTAACLAPAAPAGSEVLEALRRTLDALGEVAR